MAAGADAAGIRRMGCLCGLAELLSQPLTRNQVELMQIDTTASENLPGFRAIRISPRSGEDELEEILRQDKPKSFRDYTDRPALATTERLGGGDASAA